MVSCDSGLDAGIAEQGEWNGELIQLPLIELKVIDIE